MFVITLVVYMIIGLVGFSLVCILFSVGFPAVSFDGVYVDVVSGVVCWFVVFTVGVVGFGTWFRLWLF